MASTPSTAAVSQRVRTCEVTDDHLRIEKQCACFSGIAREGPYGAAFPDGRLHDKTPDAAGGTDNGRSEP
jgi:hypothetical protein